jgi:hypothetical protein
LIIRHVRYGNFEDILSRINEYEGGIEKMALGFKSFGCHVENDNTFVVREWAPGAQVFKIFGVVTVAGMGRGSSVLYFHPILEQKLPKIGRKYTKIGLKRSPKANFYSKRLKIGYSKVFLTKTR